MNDKIKRIVSLLLIIICAAAVIRDFATGGPLTQGIISVLQQFTQEQAADPADPGDINIIPVDPDNGNGGSETPSDPQPADPGEGGHTAVIDEHGTYDSKEDVALYIHTYGRLPDNYITKKEAEKLGWSGGSVEKYAPGKCIGGSYFGNYEGLLPKKKGRSYYECDIDTLGKSSRGAKRIIFSDDGLIYYTSDHYESFELLYGEP